jgi:hypothetical protein
VQDTNQKEVTTLMEGGLLEDIAALVPLGALSCRCCIAAEDCTLFKLSKADWARISEPQPSLPPPPLSSSVCNTGIKINDFHKVKCLVVLGEGGYAQVLKNLKP